METLVTLSVLSLLLVVIFGTFGMATSIFQDTDVRQSSENQLRSIKLLMERDLELGDFWLLNTMNRPIADPPTSRDAFAIGTLADWDNPAQFDSVTGRPSWNRYIVWYATQESSGKMVRQVVEPPGGAVLTAPYANLGANLNDDPDLNAHVLYSRTLSERLRNFQVEAAPQNGTLKATIGLQTTGAKRPNSQQNTMENLELTLVFLPRNTWPKI